MPNVTVKYLMVFSQITKKRREEVTLKDSASLGDLVEILVKKYGRKLKKALGRDLEHRSVLFYVNGEETALDSTLRDGDEVIISYPVGGG